MNQSKVKSLFKEREYEEIFLDVPVYKKPYDFYIETSMYNLVIPTEIKKEESLDIFQESVLSLLSLKALNKNQLAERLCLPEDLIYLIISKLLDLGYLKTKTIISEVGRKILEEQKKSNETIRYLYAKIYKIDKLDLILPFVEVEEKEEINGIMTRGNLKASFGKEGKRREIEGEYIKSSSEVSYVLEEKKIRRVIKGYNKIAGNKIKAINNKPIESEYGGKCFFHFKAVLQEGDIDKILFSDGFIRDISEIYQYILSEKPEVIKNIKKDSVRNSSERENAKTEKYQGSRYQEINNYYKNILIGRNKLEEFKLKSGNKDILREKEEQYREIAKNCYSLIEWILFYFTVKNIEVEKVAKLVVKDRKANKELLINILRKLGVSEKEIKSSEMFLKSVTRQSIRRHYRNNLNPTLNVSVAILLLGAKEKFEIILNNNKTFFSELSLLHSSSAEVRHRIDAEIDSDLNKINRDLKQVKMLITLLLPDLELKDDSYRIKSHNIYNEKLKADLELHSIMESVFYETLDEDIKNEFRKISPSKKGRELPDPIDYILTLSKILEKTLSSNILLRKVNGIEKAEALKSVSNRFGKVPKSLANVSNGNYEGSKKKRGTLGGYALLYLSSIDDDLARKLKKIKITELLNKVICYRGHANNILLNINEKVLEELRDQTIKVIKIIGG